MSTSSSVNPWLPLRRPLPSAVARLFCFPYAGGSAQVFRQWPEAFSPHVQVCAVQPPGRWNRMAEPFITDVRALADAALAGLREHLRPPFALYGHSVGALVAFELARRLRARGMAPPEQLFVAARRAPQLPLPTPPIDSLDDDELVRFVSAHYAPFPEAITRDKDMRGIMLPILRADLGLDQTYVFEPDEPLECPVTALGGTDDRTVSQAGLDGWRVHAAGSFAVEMIEAGHLFLDTARHQVIRAITWHWRVPGA